MAGDEGRRGVTEPGAQGQDTTAPHAAMSVLAAEVGSWIGRYAVRKILGIGGNGVVVAAHDPELGRLVAIKLVACADDNARMRLAREAQGMARLSHPNVVTVHEVVRLGDRAGIVMELVDGENLATWGARRRRSLQEVLPAYLQAARGLAAAHRAGLVHRDFKPSNALIDREGTVRVTDFGLVRAATASHDEPEPAQPAGADRAGDASGDVAPLQLTLTRTGAVVGTPAYMAPEQHAGEVADARADQWALACSLYEGLYGRRPIAGDSHEELAAAARSGTIQPEPADAAVPRRIRAAIRRALSPRPADRFATVDAFIAELAPPRRVWRMAAAAGAAAIAAVIAALVALVAMRGGDQVTCSELDAPLNSIWNRARSAALRAEFAAAGLRYAPEAAHRAIAALDDYGARWVAARTAACTRAREGTGSSDLLDRQMRCLDRRLVEMSALVAALVQPTASAIRGAGEAVARLHPVADCADPREAVPRPADPQARAQIAAAENEVARGSAMHALGECERAIPLARSAAATGERTGWSPLLARALVLRGECENRLGEYQVAVATLDRAATAAAQAADDALVAEALSDRFFVLGERLGKPGEALKGRRFIELALERAGQPRRQRAIWLHVLAVVLLNQGTHDEALAAQTEAIAIWRDLVPPGHINLIDSLETQANIHGSRGDLAAARTLLDEVMASELAASGPDHPRVASVLTNIGVLDIRSGDIPAAIERWKRASAIKAASGIVDWVPLYNLGLSESVVGRWRDAVGSLSAALAAAEGAAPGDTLPVAACATALGSVLTELGDLDRAEAMQARALRAGRAAGDTWLAEALASAVRLELAAGDVAGGRARLREATRLTRPETPLIALVAAEVAHAGEGCRAARARYEHVLAIAKPDSIFETTAATAGLGECLTELGQAEAAVTRLELRLAWLEQMRADPGASARIRFALARALLASGGDRARARALAEAARAGSATLGEPGERHAAEIARWMRRPR